MPARPIAHNVPTGHRVRLKDIEECIEEPPVADGTSPDAFLRSMVKWIKWSGKMAVYMDVAAGAANEARQQRNE